MKDHARQEEHQRELGGHDDSEGQAVITVDKGKEGRIPRTRTSSHPLRANVLSPDLRVREIRHILCAVGEAVGLVVPDFRKGAMFSMHEYLLSSVLAPDRHS